MPLRARTRDVANPRPRHIQPTRCIRIVASPASHCSRFVCAPNGRLPATRNVWPRGQHIPALAVLPAPRRKVPAPNGRLPATRSVWPRGQYFPAPAVLPAPPRKVQALRGPMPANRSMWCLHCVAARPPRAACGRAAKTSPHLRCCLSPTARCPHCTAARLPWA